MKLWSEAVLNRLRGGEGARIALLLALLAMNNLLCGCSRSNVVPTGKRTVRIEALLTLHPAWAQVESLDRASAQFLPPHPLSGTVAPALPPLPTGFAPPHALPATLPRQRQEHAEQVKGQYLQQLAETLKLQINGSLARLARRQKQTVQLTYVKELEQQQTLIHSERLRQVEDLERQITRLRLRDVAFKTQIQVYKGQALIDAQLQHDALKQQMAQLTVKENDLLNSTDIADLAKKAMEPRLVALQQQADQKLEQERTAREARRADRLKREQEKVVYEADPLPPIDMAPLPAPDERETPLTLAPGVQSPAAFAAANVKAAQAANRQQATWKAQRDRLVDLIRGDTQQAVVQIARQYGWTLTAPGAAGASDETETVKPLLRAQWQQGAQPK